MGHSNPDTKKPVIPEWRPENREAVLLSREVQLSAGERLRDPGRITHTALEAPTDQAPRSNGQRLIPGRIKRKSGEQKTRRKERSVYELQLS